MASVVTLSFLFIVFVIFQGSFNPLVNCAEVSSQQNEASNLSIINILKALNITQDGFFDFNGMIQKLNLENVVNTTSIINRLNLKTSDDGRVDLKSLLQNFDLTKYVSLNDALGLLNVNIKDGVLDFTALEQKITSSGGLTQYLNSAPVNTTEDGRLDFNGLAKKYFERVEEHSVTTEDGYILKVFRIPGDTNKVVILSHGWLLSADDYILRGYSSLVYLLAQTGYDVWVINYRGNKYSRNHKTLDPNTDDQFWQYSMQEFGYYDLPAIIDYILLKTGQKKLSIIGHSEGAAAVFVLTSTRTEYNDKIKTFVALSPVCYVSDRGLVFRSLLRTASVVSDIIKSKPGYQEVMRVDSNSRKFIQLLCSQGQVGYDLCYRGAFAALCGYYPDNLEPEFFISVLSHFPAGSSLKNMLHYDQIAESNKFAQYDYGSKNKEIYGSENAPIYDFSKVTCNVTLVVAKNDNIFGPKDLERVENALPYVNSFVVEDDQFSHAGFIYGLNAPEQVYLPVIDELYKFNN